jgi:hypothetical protein
LGIFGEHFLFLVGRAHYRHGILQAFQEIRGKGILPVAHGEDRVLLDIEIEGLVFPILQDVAADTAFQDEIGLPHTLALPQEDLALGEALHQRAFYEHALQFIGYGNIARQISPQFGFHREGPPFRETEEERPARPRLGSLYQDIEAARADTRIDGAHPDVKMAAIEKELNEEASA